MMAPVNLMPNTGLGNSNAYNSAFYNRPTTAFSSPSFISPYGKNNKQLSTTSGLPYNNFLSTYLQPSGVSSLYQEKPSKNRPQPSHIQRPKTIAVIGSHEGGLTTRDIDGDGINDLTDLEWHIELLQANHPNARIIEYSAPTATPENIGHQIDALNEDMESGLSVDDVLIPLQDMGAYSHFTSKTAKQLTPQNIKEASTSLEPRENEAAFQRLNAVFKLVEELARRVTVHIPGGDNLGYLNQIGQQTHFNLWSLVSGAKHYRSVNKHGEVEDYSNNNSLLNSEGKGELVITKQKNGFDINEDGKIDIPINDPRLSGRTLIANKFENEPVQEAVVNDEEFKKLIPLLKEPLRFYRNPISIENFKLLKNKLIPLDKLYKIGRLPENNQHALDILGEFAAVGQDGLVFGFRRDQFDRIVYRPFKLYTPQPNTTVVNFMLGSDIATVAGISDKVKHIYHD